MRADDELNSLYHEALQDYGSGKTADAETKLRAVLERSHHDDASESLSVILYNQKRYDEAVTVLKHWITKNPGSLMAHTNLSRCYAAQGLIAEAEQEQAVARQLTWKQQLQEKKQAAPKVDLSEEVAKYRNIINYDPSDVLGYYSLGTLYLNHGKNREAMDIFEKAVEVSPEHSASYLGLGQAAEGLGDKAKARRIYEAGIRVADKNGDMLPQKKMESRLNNLDK